VNIPSLANMVEILTDALVDGGKHSFVLVRRVQMTPWFVEPAADQ
jgi:hypothetical protein